MTLYCIQAGAEAITIVTRPPAPASRYSTPRFNKKSIPASGVQAGGGWTLSFKPQENSEKYKETPKNLQTADACRYF